MRAYGIEALLSVATIDAQCMKEHVAKGRINAIQARKSAYTPNEMTLKRGEPDVLTLTAIDFMHGFFIPT